MALDRYTFKVTDFSGQTFLDASPSARIEPVGTASVPGRMLSDRRIPVPLFEDGSAVVYLEASKRYQLIVDWLTATRDGQKVPSWVSEWEFYARAGGGDIATMGATPDPLIFFGPPWPEPAPPGIYYDTTSGWYGRKDALS